MAINPNLLAAPVVVPLLIAALGLLFTRWGYRSAARAQRLLAFVGVSINLLIAVALLVYTLTEGRLVLQMGLWIAPFGISLVADGLSTIMLTLTAVLAVGVVSYAAGTLDQRERMNYYSLILFLVMGVNGAFLAGDIFNLYVFFEVLLMASFVLLTLGGQPAQINGGIRYVLLNLLASAVLLSAVGVVYGTLGTLNMAQVAIRMAEAPTTVQYLLAGLLLVAFSSKAGLFPLFFWLPSSYHTAHPSVTAFFGGLLTKVGIYTLFRIFPLIFPAILIAWQPLILAIAGLTMLTGVFGAMAVHTVRRVLSFHIISHVGFMALGLGLAASSDRPAAVFGMAAGIFYLIHHMIVKTSLLMAGGAAEMEVGSGSLLRDQLSGLVGRRPVLAVVFFLSAMSIAGIPPFSGFTGKLALLEGTLAGQFWLVAAISLFVSLLTMVNMIRLWQKAFWGETHGPLVPRAPLAYLRGRWLTLTPIAALVSLSLAIGIFSGAVFHWSEVAAIQVLDREGYIDAVAPVDEINRIISDSDAAESHK